MQIRRFFRPVSQSRGRHEKRKKEFSFKRTCFCDFSPSSHFSRRPKKEKERKILAKAKRGNWTSEAVSQSVSLGLWTAAAQRLTLHFEILLASVTDDFWIFRPRSFCFHKVASFWMRVKEKLSHAEVEIVLIIVITVYISTCGRVYGVERRAVVRCPHQSTWRRRQERCLHSLFRKTKKLFNDDVGEFLMISGQRKYTKRDSLLFRFGAPFFFPGRWWESTLE